MSKFPYQGNQPQATAPDAPEIVADESYLDLDPIPYMVFARWIDRKDRNNLQLGKNSRISPDMEKCLIAGNPRPISNIALSSLTSDARDKNQINQDVRRMLYDTGLCLESYKNTGLKQLVVGCPAMLQRFIDDTEELPENPTHTLANANYYARTSILPIGKNGKIKGYQLIVNSSSEETQNKWTTATWVHSCLFPSADAAHEMEHDLKEHLSRFMTPVKAQYVNLIVEQYLAEHTQSREKTAFNTDKFYAIAPRGRPKKIVVVNQPFDGSGKGGGMGF